MSIWPPAFNQDAEFFATREFPCIGKWYQRGDLFDKDSVPVRTLRTMYENKALIQRDASNAKEVDAYLARARRHQKPQLDHDRDGEPGGVVNPHPLTRDERHALLMRENRPDLIAKAKELGIEHEPDATKRTLADLIIDAEDAKRDGNS